MWYHNTFLLQPNDRVTMYPTGNKYILKIHNFHLSDFGNYRSVSQIFINQFEDFVLSCQFVVKKEKQD